MDTTIRSDRRPVAGETGAALVLALVGSLLLTSLGLGLVLLGDTEAASSANYRAAQETLYAADAIAERVAHELSQLSDWTPALNGTIRSAFTGASALTTPYGEALDVVGLTTEVQAQSDAVASWGANSPRWSLFAHGPFSAIDGAGTVQSLAYVTAWIADDPAETDNNPEADANGVVTVLAQARGPRGARRVVSVTMARGCAEPDQVLGPSGTVSDPPECREGSREIVRVLSWREIR